MTKLWLLLDVNSLAHRAMHSTGDMQFAGEDTGVIFGVLRTVFELQDRFQAYSVVPCFDHGKGLREIRHSFYKETRRKRKLTEEQDVAYRAMREQVTRLRADIFPRLGCSNVLFQEGYEADDIIASVCHNLPDEDEAVVVTGDKDMYQLLSDTVKVYHPVTQKLVTRKGFRKEWKLGPATWADIKAIAGCGTDDVPGVEGVQEKTAAKFYRGVLPKHHLTYKAIMKFVDTEDHRRNLALVTLPFAGCKQFKLKPDNLDLEAREEILTEYGIRSFS